MTRLSAVFMGTPQAAVPSLEALHRTADVGLVVTRPDRPRGRSRRPQPPPVKEAAQQMSLEVAQPENARSLASILEGMALDVGVVVAFGMILRPEVLAMPRTGFLNVHFSLLPRWRGAAPVERAIMAGDHETGVTIMLMDEGLDTGPIVAQKPTRIDPHETGGALTQRLAEIGADLLAEALPAWVAGEITAEPQPEEGSTYAARLERNDRIIGSDMIVTEFVNAVRALAPEPGAQLWIDDRPHKILSVQGVEGAPVDEAAWTVREGWPCLTVADGAVRIVTIQPPGRRPMDAQAWLRGHSLPPG